MYSALEIINKKKRNEPLLKEEIEYIIKGFMDGTIKDYQMSAFLMAIYFTEMTAEEVAYLTEAMVHSGQVIDLSFIDDVVVDKHSTGGVGDKVSLLVVPIIASLGIPIIKMSGKGLGHTGGTIDKLEAIKGFRAELSEADLIDHAQTYKIALVGQTENIAPADKEIYALRDVTGTVDSLPLIASSIMSKKLATGVDGIVLDVKVGDGAFMKTVEDATALAEMMVQIGESLNKQVTAILTPMNQPLGREVGNINEVQEAVRLLKNESFDDDLYTVTLEVAAQMAQMSTKYNDFSIEALKQIVEEHIKNGAAYEKFVQLITIQGGDVDAINHVKYEDIYSIKALEDGYITKVKTEEIGYIASRLGAGRETTDSVIDYDAGLTIHVKIGDYVKKGEVILTGRTNRTYDQSLQKRMEDAFTISHTKDIETTSPILGIVRSK
ncbi:MAG TPA: thymidine phosphorylase [Bacillota bacterium]|nr:thymidine phosphorylase [Bacillota bacterium]